MTLTNSITSRAIACTIAVCFYMTASAQVSHVKVTCYKAKHGAITANGSKVNKRLIKNGCVAVSPDLLHKYPHGSRIYIKGFGYFWVKDTTAKHIRNTVDILIDASDKCFMKPKVKVYKV